MPCQCRPSIKTRFTFFRSHHQVNNDSNSLPQLNVVSTTQLTARFFKSNLVHRSISFNSIQLCDGRCSWTILLAIWMEAEE